MIQRVSFTQSQQSFHTPQFAGNRKTGVLGSLLLSSLFMLSPPPVSAQGSKQGNKQGVKPHITQLFKYIAGLDANENNIIDNKKNKLLTYGSEAGDLFGISDAKKAQQVLNQLVPGKKDFRGVTVALSVFDNNQNGQFEANEQQAMQEQAGLLAKNLKGNGLKNKASDTALFLPKKAYEKGIKPLGGKFKNLFKRSEKKPRPKV